MQLPNGLPKDVKIIDYPEIVEQRFALAKWIASNPTLSKINGKDGFAMTKLLWQSELFGVSLKEKGGALITDNARACANSILSVLVNEKIQAQAICGVEVEVLDPEKMIDRVMELTEEEEDEEMLDVLAELEEELLGFEGDLLFIAKIETGQR